MENKYVNYISDEHLLSCIGNLYKAYLKLKNNINKIRRSDSVLENSVIDEIKSETKTSKRSILDQITFENYSYYLGFDKL